MEEILKEMQEYFCKEQISNIDVKIAYACGYLKNNESVNKEQAIEIIRKKLFEEI